MLAARQRAEFAVDEGNDLAREIVRIIANRGGVRVMVGCERGEAVGEGDDRRPELLLADQPRRAFRNVVAERLPARVRKPGAGEADQVVEHRKAAPARAPVILWRQPHRDLAHMRIAERIVLEDSGGMFQYDQRTGGGLWPLVCPVRFPRAGWWAILAFLPFRHRPNPATPAGD